MAVLHELSREDGWTTDDLDELPEDGYRHELIDGALIVPPPPTSGHHNLISLLAIALMTDRPWPIRVPISTITPRFHRPDA